MKLHILHDCPLVKEHPAAGGGALPDGGAAGEAAVVLKESVSREIDARRELASVKIRCLEASKLGVQASLVENVENIASAVAASRGSNLPKIGGRHTLEVGAR